MDDIMLEERLKALEDKIDLVSPSAREDRFTMRRDDTEIKDLKKQIETQTNKLDFFIDLTNRYFRKLDKIERVLGRLKHVFQRENFFIIEGD